MGSTIWLMPKKCKWTDGQLLGILDEKEKYFWLSSENGFEDCKICWLPLWLISPCEKRMMKAMLGQKCHLLKAKKRYVWFTHYLYLSPPSLSHTRTFTHTQTHTHRHTHTDTHKHFHALTHLHHSFLLRSKVNIVPTLFSIKLCIRLYRMSTLAKAAGH